MHVPKAALELYFAFSVCLTPQFWYLSVCRSMVLRQGGGNITNGGRQVVYFLHVTSTLAMVSRVLCTV